MTVVVVDSQRFANGPSAQSRGTLTYAPFKEFVSGGVITNTAPIVVAYPGASIDVVAAELPEGNAWVFRLEVDQQVIERVVRPTGAGPVNLADLTNLDPKTLTPAADQMPAWVAALGQVNSQLTVVTTEMGGRLSQAGIADTVTTAVEDAAEIQLAGVEKNYAERITNYTSTAVANTAIPGLGFDLVGNGRPIDIAFSAFQVYHSVANTPVVFMLSLAGSPFFYGLKRSPVTNGGDTILLSKRVVVPNGVTWAVALGCYGGAAGTLTITRDTTFPMVLTATSR